MNTNTSAPFTEQWGDGPDVVFILGLGESGRCWQNVREAGGGYRGIDADGVITECFDSAANHAVLDAAIQEVLA